MTWSKRPRTGHAGPYVPMTHPRCITASRVRGAGRVDPAAPTVLCNNPGVRQWGLDTVGLFFRLECSSKLILEYTLDEHRVLKKLRGDKVGPLTGLGSSNEVTRKSQMATLNREPKATWRPSPSIHYRRPCLLPL